MNFDTIKADASAIWNWMVREEHTLADAMTQVLVKIHVMHAATVTPPNGNTQQAVGDDPAPAPPVVTIPVDAAPAPTPVDAHGTVDYAKWPDLVSLAMWGLGGRAPTPAEVAAWYAVHPEAPRQAGDPSPTPQGQDGASIARARTLLNGFGQHAFVHGKGAIAYSAPSFPARAISVGQVSQAPGFTYPEAARIWFGVTASDPAPDGLVGGIDANNVIKLPAQTGFICFDSDTGGEFDIELQPDIVLAPPRDLSGRDLTGFGDAKRNPNASGPYTVTVPQNGFEGGGFEFVWSDTSGTPTAQVSVSVIGPAGSFSGSGNSKNGHVPVAGAKPGEVYEVQLSMSPDGILDVQINPI